MDIAELSGHTAACVRDKPPQTFEQDFLPFQVLNCKYEEASFNPWLIRSITACFRNIP